MQRLGLQNHFFLQSIPWDLIPFLGPDCGSTHDYYYIYMYLIYIYVYSYTIYTCWILLVFHQIQMPCRLDLSVAISLHFPLAKARAARSTVYWEWVGVRVGFDKVDRPKTKERRGQSLPQCIPSWVSAIRGSPAPGETSVSHNLWWYIYIYIWYIHMSEYVLIICPMSSKSAKSSMYMHLFYGITLLTSTLIQ